MEKENLLSIRNLKLGVKKQRSDEWLILAGVEELSLKEGEILALVGETGSGKSLTAASCQRLFPSKAIEVLEGEIFFNGKDILGFDKKHIAALRGKEIAMIFQDPMSALNPVFRVGALVKEVLRSHFKLSTDEIHKRAVAAFEAAGLNESLLTRYPHELSGGQRQRVCIACALASEPKLLIADEPTTALDVTIQAQILNLLEKLRDEHSLAILFITHNLNIVSHFASRTAVMHNGKVVEQGETQAVLQNPSHEYTRMLLSWTRIPKFTSPFVSGSADAKPVIELHNVKKTYLVKQTPFDKGKLIHALDDINLEVHHGESIGIVGESGSGKTTLARLLMQLEHHSLGEINVSGRKLGKLRREELAAHYRVIQMVYQDSLWAMNPFMTIEQIVMEPLVHNKAISREERLNAAHTTLEQVGITSEHYKKYPGELSGGQRQRTGIARAIIQKPEILILDEPSSALDVRVQMQILELLQKIRTEYALTYILISHDLAVVRAMCDTVAVLCKGKLIEYGPVETIFTAAQSSYTRELINAAQ